MRLDELTMKCSLKLKEYSTAVHPALDECERSWPGIQPLQILREEKEFVQGAGHCGAIAIA